MNESENALPLDSSFWEHVEHMGFDVVIPVSETRSMDVMQVLYDIYMTMDESVEEAKQLVISMAAILIACHNDSADEVWEELVIDRAKKQLDKTLEEILNEKP